MNCVVLRKNWFLVTMVVVLCVRIFVEMVFGDFYAIASGADIRFTGCISDEPDIRDFGTKYVLDDVSFFGGKVLVNANKYPVMDYGSKVFVSGKIESPGEFSGFDYGEYLNRYGIYYVVNDAEVSAIGGYCGNVFMEGIYWLKNMIEKRILEVYPSPYGEFVAGIILGLRKNISQDLLDDFKQIGLTHILAISGYNITLVVMAAYFVFGFLSRRWKVLATSIFIILFVVLVGASASAVRAGVMGIIQLLAVYFGRRTLALRSLIWTLVVVGLWNPLIVVYDVGFQLSFGATLGLIVLSPLVKNAGGLLGRILLRIPTAFLIRENFIMTMSAQVFTLPVILYNFGRFSIVSFLANLAILPMIPYVMIFGGLSLVFGKIFGFVCYALMKIIFFVVRLLAF